MQLSSHKAAVVLLISLAFTISYLPETFNDFTVGGGGFWMCIDYVGDLNLYGGQAYCGQPPLFYYLSYFLSLILGDGTLLYFMWLLVIVASAGNYLILRIICKRMGVYAYPILELLFLFLVYRSISYIPSTLATFFILSAHYILSYTTFGHKRLMGAILLALSAYMKISTLPVVFALIAYHSFVSSGVRFDGGRIKAPNDFIARAIKQASILSIPLMSMTLLFSFAYPLFFEYVFFSHSDQLVLTLGEGLQEMLERNIMFTWATLSVFTLLGYLVVKGIFKRSELIYPSMVYTSLVLCASFLMQNGDLRFGSHYSLPVMPFLVISCMVIYGKDRLSFTTLIVLMLIYPSIYEVEIGNPIVDATRSEIDKIAIESRILIEQGLSFIPKQKGAILYEHPKGSLELFERHGLDAKSWEMDVIPSGVRGFPAYEDPLWAPFLRKRLKYNTSFNKPYGVELTKDENKIKNELLSGRYSLLVVSPPSWFSISKIIESSKEYVSENYCVVYVPSFEYFGQGRYHSALLFSQLSHCDVMNSKMKRHYTENFPKICNVSLPATGVVYNVMKFNEIEVDSGCIDKPRMKPVFHPKERVRTTIFDILLTMSLIAISYQIIKRI